MKWDEPAPGERQAGERSWAVVRAAWESRIAHARPRRHRATLVAVAATLAVAAAILSPPGLAVLSSIRDAVRGEKNAKPALFSLPSEGKLLVVTQHGAWIASADGSKRFLGTFADASWSPHGRFVVASRPTEISALDPKGNVRWTLSRPDTHLPSWGGSDVDTRIAYLTTSRLHVVAGDGTGDVDAGGLPAAARVRPAWRPGLPFVLAYADTRGRVYAYELTGALLWRSAPLPHPRFLQWSSDGREVLVLTRDKIAVLRGGKPVFIRFAHAAAAAFRPGTRAIAEIRSQGGTSEVVMGRRVLFRGTGEFRQLAWSPDGRWLLVSWPTADQWIFIRVAGPRRIVAVSSITRQFDSETFPSISGWCCP
jgi:hypothetical protein